jgi:hypothetical protein
MYDLRKIQIGIPCGPNSESFANFLIETIELTISDKFDYRFVIGINKAGVDINKIIGRIDKNKFSFVEEISSEQSSKGHAHCLNLIVRNMTTKYGFLIDADVAMLSKNWDIALTNELTDKVVMIGSEYYKTDGKMVRRPNVITCAIDVEVFHKLNLNFMPSMKTIEIDQELSSVYGVEPGSKIFMDTGCEIIEKIIKNGYYTKVLNIVSPRYTETQSALKVLKKSGRGEEYHLEGMPISTHIGRSLTRNFDKDHTVNEWKHLVKEWLNGKV